MKENSDEDESENDVVEASVSMSASTSMNVEATIAFSANRIQEQLENDEYALALVSTSTQLESILSRAIQNEYDVTRDQFEKLYGRESLGRYQDMSAILGLFDDHQGTIQEVVNHRTKLVHEYGYLKEVQENQDVRDELRKTLEKAIEFIEVVEL